MLNFKPVTLADREWMAPIIYKENTRNADYSFVNIYAGGASYEARWTCVDGCLVIWTVIAGVDYYAFPLGADTDEKLRAVVDALLDHCRERGDELRLISIAPAQVPRLETLSPGRFAFTPRTELFDYVYSAERLSTLAGKKLHAKRNFIHHFEAEHEWKLEAMSAENIALWADLDSEWIIDQEGAALETALAEVKAIRTALGNFDRLGLEGAFLYADGKPCAFTVGERLCEDTYVIHYEKADSSIVGAYPMINREFVRMIRQKFPALQWINREDDMGLENLRKAKRSYYPDFMEEKYKAVTQP